MIAFCSGPSPNLLGALISAPLAMSRFRAFPFDSTVSGEIERREKQCIGLVPSLLERETSAPFLTVEEKHQLNVNPTIHNEGNQWLPYKAIST